MAEQKIPSAEHFGLCPKCSAVVGARCRTSSGAATTKAHEARWRLFYRDYPRQLGPMTPMAALLGEPIGS